MRHVEFAVGYSLEEEIVTSDDALRRFQYRIVESNIGSSKGPVSNLIDHLATVDVIEGGAGSLVIYSTDVVSADDRAASWSVWSPSRLGDQCRLPSGLKEYSNADNTSKATPLVRMAVRDVPVTGRRSPTGAQICRSVGGSL